MRYDSQVGNQEYNTGGAAATNMNLTGDIMPVANPLPQDPRTTYNPGVKPSGAPVPFNPAAQANMTDMFGMPMNRSYNRAVRSSF